ncbi:MAG TPA: plastocyanin/azurin family copper-binding protein [Gemmatimonadaceae bacterium]|nr:plastocyanin/azurin family copper-binding protein [Gemmatimonadaceae bacterium]
MNRLFAPILLALVLVVVGSNVGEAQQVVTADGKQFSTTEMRISYQDTVVFMNYDAVPHQVFSSSNGLRFNLKRLLPGSGGAVRFAKRGVAEVRCAIHRDMRMKIIVE